MEQMPQNNINLIGRGAEKIKDPKEIQAEYLNHLENYFKGIVEKRRLPESEAGLESIFNEEGKPPAFIDRIHAPRERKTRKILRGEEGDVRGQVKYNLPQEGYQRLWIVIDFDDTLNKTTSYHENLKKSLCEAIDMSPEVFKQLYDEAKQTNQEGKKVLKFDLFVEEIKKRFPGKEMIIDNIIKEEINSGQYLDQAVKRSLLAMRLSSEPIRVSVLTFGDIKYQKERVDRTDLRDIVDDVIYTEGSKGETLDKLMKMDYKPGIKPPFVITVDDSPEQINDLDSMPLKEDFVNVHFRNPQAKRFNDVPNVRNASVLEEELGDGAVNLYKLMRVCLSDDMQLTRQNIYKTLKDKNYSDIYKETIDSRMGMFPNKQKEEKNIVYRQESNGDIVREGDCFLGQEIEHIKEIIGKDGKLLEIRPRAMSGELSESPINYEEFIRDGI